MIVSRVKNAASPLTFTKISPSAAAHISAPRTKAEPVGTLPVGMGRSAVRRIWASVSCSIHWFSAATPAAARLVPTTTAKSSPTRNGGRPVA